MAINTYRVFLMKKDTTGGGVGTYKKLIDIKSFPALGGAPELLETTTMSDNMKTFINGIQGASGLEFEHNYTLADYKALKTLEGKELEYAVWFGGTGDGAALVPTGSDGKFKFKGTLSVYVDGANVNEVVKMKTTIAPSTPIELEN